MIPEEYTGARRWSRNRQAVATVVWISFLSAAIATMVFFAVFDPVEMVAELGLEFGRQAGYAAGFFFFWILSALSSGLTAWLIRTAPGRKPQKH